AQVRFAISICETPRDALTTIPQIGSMDTQVNADPALGAKGLIPSPGSCPMRPLTRSAHNLACAGATDFRGESRLLKSASPLSRETKTGAPLQHCPTQPAPIIRRNRKELVR